MASEISQYASRTNAPKVELVYFKDTIEGLMTNLDNPEIMLQHAKEVETSLKEAIYDKGGIKRFNYLFGKKAFDENKKPIAAGLITAFENGHGPIKNESRTVAYTLAEIEKLGNEERVKIFEKAKIKGAVYCSETLHNEDLANEFMFEDFQAIDDFLKTKDCDTLLYKNVVNMVKTCRKLKRDVMPLELINWVNLIYFQRSANVDSLKKLGRFVDENLKENTRQNVQATIIFEPLGYEGDYSFGCKKSGIVVEKDPSLLSARKTKIANIPLEFNGDIEALSNYYLGVVA